METKALQVYEGWEDSMSRKQQIEDLKEKAQIAEEVLSVLNLNIMSIHDRHLRKWIQDTIKQFNNIGKSKKIDADCPGQLNMFDSPKKWRRKDDAQI